MPCLLCGKYLKLTREHIYKRALVDYFCGKKEKDYFFSFIKKRFINTKDARALKPKKNLCKKCNNETSQPLDDEFELLFKKMDGLSKTTNVEKFDGQRLDCIDKSDERTKNIYNVAMIMLKEAPKEEICIDSLSIDIKKIKGFIAKHIICRLDRDERNIPPYLKDIFFQRGSFEKLRVTAFLMNEENDFGIRESELMENTFDISFQIAFGSQGLAVAFDK